MTDTLFPQRKLEPLTGITEPEGPTNSTVANVAYTDSIALNDPEGYQQRKASGTTTIQEEALIAIRDQLRAAKIPDSPYLEPENFVQLPFEQQLSLVEAEMRRVKSTNFTPRQYALIHMMKQGYGERESGAFDEFYRNVSPDEIIELMNYDNRLARQAARRDIDQYNAANGWNNGAEAVMEVAIGDLTPIWPLLSRWGVVEAMEEAMGLEDVNGFWLGSGRQRIREQIVQMSPQEFEEAFRAWSEWLDFAQGDPLMGPLLSKYNVMELHEAVFTDDVIDGASAENKGDLYLGNFETLLEATFSVAVMAKAGITTMKAFTKTSEVTAHHTARAADPKVATRVEDDLDTPQLSLDFNLLPEESAASKLPRPQTLFNGQVDELPDGTKQVVIESERRAAEIVERSGRATELGLTATDKTRQVNRSIADLDINDGAHVQGRMNEIAMFDDGSGYRMRVVVGENAEGGYKNLEDAMDEVVDIDPNLESVSIMRVNGDGVLEPVFDSALDYARALTKGEIDTKTAERLLEGRADESYYLVYDREHYWNPIDKEAFGPETFTSGWMPRFMLSPNAKFGEDIYPQFLKAYMEEQSIIKDFDAMFKPFYDLTAEDKAFVQSVFEVQEQFAKNYGRQMTITEMKALFPQMTNKQLDGIVALQTGFDTMHHLFDRRLYRQGISLGWKTARPVTDSKLPIYHGKILDEDIASRTAKYYDPVSQKMIPLNRAEIEDIYRQGGGVMELDVPIEVGAKSRATHVVMKPDDYEIGELSTRILKYHPGYSPRFYDDPYYVIKRTEGAEVNGSKVKGKQGTIVEAIKTSGTAREAERFARRANFRNEQRGVEGETFEVVRANDIEQTDSTLFQKQALHREGRLFWDDRNFDRLPDVNGNRAALENPVQSLERWVGQAARQLSHEDLIRTIRQAWKNDYGNIIEGADVLLDRLELGELSKRLRAARRNAVSKAERAKIQQAKELIDYMRMVDGTQSGIVPILREAALSLATTVESWTKLSKFGRAADTATFGLLNKGAKSLEKVGGTIDPFRTMRSVAFNVFLVFRPVRQALLQSAQIGYLSGIAPGYVGSGKIFTDAFALRRGLIALRKSGYDDGFSSKEMAKLMGITHSEYRTLIREFDRSGLLELVDVHSFAGGSARFRKKYPGRTGAIGYRSKQFATGVRDWFQKWGFDFGERNNLTFTYQLALRRHMKGNGIKSINDLTRSDWDKIKVDASNLALGMVKPNNFAYQQGGFGVMTQFMSFGHKAMLGLLAQNPAINFNAAVRIWAGSLLLYGANMFGARDAVEQALKDQGIPNYQVTEGISTVDILSAGLVDTIFNAMGDTLFEDWKDVDFGFLAPGLDFPRFFDMTLQNIVEQPAKGALGPFGNIASDVLTAYEFAHTLAVEDDEIALEDKFMGVAALMGSATFPALNDLTRAYLGYQMGLWYNKSNEPMPLRATFNGLIARGLFGARTKEELSWYRNQSNWWEQQEAYQDTVRTMNDYLNQTITLFYGGKTRPEDIKRAALLTHALTEDLPEDVKIQFRKDVFNGLQQNDFNQPSLFKVIIENALANPRMDPTQVTASWRHMEIPEDHKRRLEQMAQDAYSNKAELIRNIEEQERDD